MTKEKVAGKSKPLIITLAIIVFVLLMVVIFMISPLKEMLFPSPTAPTITLSILEGPALDEETDLYYYVVEAIVTGYPAPELIFNRNDGIGQMEKNQTLVLLEEGEVFLLKAAVSNSLGSADDTLELLTGEDAMGNLLPVISGIDFSSDMLFVNKDYTLTAIASDPDGDPLSYDWEISGEGWLIEDSTTNPVLLTTPEAPGEYLVRVVASDGHGEEVEYSETVSVLDTFVLVPPLVAVPTILTPNEIGHIVKDYNAYSNYVQVGDDWANRIYRGFISFDIGDLEGYSVGEVVLRLENPVVYGNPSDLHHDTLGLWVGVVQWGARPLQVSDYSLPGVGIGSFTDYNITTHSTIGESDEKLAQELQKAIDEGRDRFQIRLHFANENSNNNDSADGLRYGISSISLEVMLQH